MDGIQLRSKILLILKQQRCSQDHSPIQRQPTPHRTNESRAWAMSCASTVDQKIPPDERTGEQWSGVLSGPVSTAGDRKRKSRGRVPPRNPVPVLGPPRNSIATTQLRRVQCMHCISGQSRERTATCASKHESQTFHKACANALPCHAVPRRSRSPFPRFPDPLGGPDRDPTGQRWKRIRARTDRTAKLWAHVAFRSGAPPARPHSLRCCWAGLLIPQACCLCVKIVLEKNPSSHFLVGFLGRASDP